MSNTGASLFLGGAGADSFAFNDAAGTFSTFNGTVSIVGGTGNDSIVFTSVATNGFVNGAGTSQAVTYFFGSDTGNDTISFAGQGTNPLAGFTVAADSAFGATSAFTFTASTSLVAIGTGGSQRTIFIDGLTGGASGNFAGLGITFTTVASSVITAFG